MRSHIETLRWICQKNPEHFLAQRLLWCIDACKPVANLAVADLEGGLDRRAEIATSVMPTILEVSDTLHQAWTHYIRVELASEQVPPVGPRSATPTPKWKKTQQQMLELWKKRRLPSTMRDVERMYHVPYSTVRAAALKSQTLRQHFGLQMTTSERHLAEDHVWDELLARADPKTRKFLVGLTPERQERAKAAVMKMDRDDVLAMLNEISTNPDSGWLTTTPDIDEL